MQKYYWIQSAWNILNQTVLGKCMLSYHGNIMGWMNYTNQKYVIAWVIRWVTVIFSL